MLQNVTVTATATATATELLDTVSELSEQFYVVDSNEAAAALGAEIEVLLSSTMQVLASEHARANANFGRAIDDLYRALR